MRFKVERLREKISLNGYNCQEMNLPLVDSEDVWKRFLEQNQPLISTIIRINQQSLELLLLYIAKWIKVTPLANKWLGSWLYSICACLSFPIDPCVYSCLRNIAKVCLEYRENFTAEQSLEVVPYNLIILIIANVYGQKDFNEIL